MSAYLSVVKKEATHITRDPATLVMALMVPLIQLIIFGYAIDFDVRHIQTAYVDLDRSHASRDYLASLHATQYVDFVKAETSPELVADDLRSGAARIGVVIPPDFARRKASGLRPQVEVLIDGSDSTTATRAQAAFAQPVTTGMDIRQRVLFNPNMRTQTFMIPGLIGMILQIVTVSLTSFSLVKEREQGTMEQLMVSPLGKLDLMLGKLTPYAGLAMLEMIGVILFGHFVFDIQVQGSVVLLMCLAVPFVLASLGLGLLISTVAKNQAQALQMSMLITMPSMLMSGFTFPRETMPGALWLVSNLIPLTHFLRILRGVIVRGAGMADLVGPTFALVAIAFTLVAISTLRFRKSIG